MSMPLPIRVALVGSRSETVRAARKHFRLGAPGIGAPYLASLESAPADLVLPIADVPAGLITLWVALDEKAFRESQDRHRADTQLPVYDRGFYERSLPEPCVLVDWAQAPAEAKKLLAELAQKISKAWSNTG